MKILRGDLIELAKDGHFDVIVHGCNCFCMMGAGIAAQIAREFPQAKIIDRLTTGGSREKLGEITTAVCQGSTGPIVVVNAYTQYRYERHVLQVNYESLRNCFTRVRKLFRNHKIGYPKIGAGLAGGDWDIIKDIIDSELEGMDHTLVVWDKE